MDSKFDSSLGIYEDEEDEVQRRELQRLLGTAKNENRRAAVQKTLVDFDSRNIVGNDTILTSDFSSANLHLQSGLLNTNTLSTQNHSIDSNTMMGLTSSSSAKNLLGINSYGSAKTLARPGSASASRQRRPSISLDAIPESVNEHRPDSNYSKHHSDVSPTAKSAALYAALHDVKDGKYNHSHGSTGTTASSAHSMHMNGSKSNSHTNPSNNNSGMNDGIYHLLNLNLYSGETEVKYITASCHYPSHSGLGCTRQGMVLEGRRKPSNGSHSKQLEEEVNCQVNWLCTGLSPQILYLTFTCRMDIQHVRIECIGEVEELSIQVYTQSISTPANNYTCTPYSMNAAHSIFEVNINSSSGSTSTSGRDKRQMNQTNVYCEQISITINKATDVFFGIKAILINGMKY